MQGVEPEEGREQVKPRVWIRERPLGLVVGLQLGPAAAGLRGLCPFISSQFISPEATRQKNLRIGNAEALEKSISTTISPSVLVEKPQNVLLHSAQPGSIGGSSWISAYWAQTLTLYGAKLGAPGNSL